MSLPRTYWDRLYAERAPDTLSWYQPEPAISLELIERCRLRPGAPLLDVGGGTSLLVDRLLDLGYERPAVLDFSGAALNIARERLGERAARVEWFEEDIADFEPPHPFALWHDRAVFHYMAEEADRLRYIETLNRTLEVGGHLIVSAFTIGGPQLEDGLATVPYDSARLCTELGRAYRLIEATGEMHVTPQGEEQAYAYFRFIRER